LDGGEQDGQAAAAAGGKTRAEGTASSGGLLLDTGGMGHPNSQHKDSPGDDSHSSLAESLAIMNDAQFNTLVPKGDPAEMAAGQRRVQTVYDTEEREHWDQGAWEGLKDPDLVEQKEIAGLMAEAWIKHIREAGLDTAYRLLPVCAEWETADV